MKKAVVSIGKAIGYLGIFLGTQFLVTMVFMIGYLFFDKSESDKQENINLIMEQATEAANASTELLQLISALLTLLVLFVMFKARGKSFTKEIVLGAVRPIEIIPVILLGIGEYFCTLFFLSMIPFPDSWVLSYTEKSGKIMQGADVVSIVELVIATPIIEEVIFRGLVYTRLKRGLRT